MDVRVKIKNLAERLLFLTCITWARESLLGVVL